MHYFLRRDYKERKKERKRPSTCRADTSLGPAGTVEDLSGILDGATINVPSMFRCGYGGCIFNQLVCNGRYDCWDKSDEDPALCAKRRYVCVYACMCFIWISNREYR